MSWTPALDMPAPIKVDVVATSGRGMTAEEVAELALNKLISISDTAPPELAAQAKAFKERMERAAAGTGAAWGTESAASAPKAASK